MTAHEPPKEHFIGLPNNIGEGTRVNLQAMMSDRQSDMEQQPKMDWVGKTCIAASFITPLLALGFAAGLKPKPAPSPVANQPDMSMVEKAQRASLAQTSTLRE